LIVIACQRIMLAEHDIVCLSNAGIVYWRVYNTGRWRTISLGTMYNPWLHLMHGIGYAQYSNLCGHQEQLLGAIW